MRLSAALLTATILAVPAHAENKSFKDWLVGCDNVLACTAVGMSGDEAYPPGYVRVMRQAGPDAAAEVRLVVMTEGGEGGAKLSVVLDGKPFGAGTFDAASDGTWARVDLPAADAAKFIAALGNARSLKLKRVDVAEAEIAVSLNGSSAALRYMDAEQKRDGGVTAIVARGDEPKSAVPAAPATPVVKATAMKVLETNPPAPKGLPEGNPEDCNGMDDTRFAIDLGDGHTLWAVCESAGAYNYGYSIYIADKAGKVTPVPPPKENNWGGDALVLVNPYAPEGEKVLSAFNKGRGLGDCGDSQSWAWTGDKLVMVRMSEMDECRGVGEEDWIGVYKAEIR